MKEIIRDSEVKAIVSSSNIEAGIKTTSKKRKTPARSAANARERSRMRVLSKVSFYKLFTITGYVTSGRLHHRVTGFQ